MTGIGDRFQEETKYVPGKLGGQALDWRARPAPFKSHESSLAILALPPPRPVGSPDFWEILKTRRSRRKYRDQPLTIQEVALLLWALQGITQRQGAVLFRTAPSAGALYPVETYLFAHHVGKLERGLYHFRPERFDLEFLRRGDISKELAEAALGQDMVGRAAVTFLWSAVVARAKWKYGQRAYRYIYLDAGHIAQNLYLAGEALGLHVCAIAAFFDELVNGLLGLDGKEETVLYMAAAGRG